MKVPALFDGCLRIKKENIDIDYPFIALPSTPLKFDRQCVNYIESRTILAFGDITTPKEGR